MLIFLIIKFIFFLQSWNCQEPTAEELNYYEDLVTQGIIDALDYKLPTDSKQYYAGDYNLIDGSLSGQYEYIVIGAGSAGAVVANRLSEVKQSKTLLLEAGGYENNFTDIPGMAFYAQGTQYNWAFTSIPQVKSCLGMIDNKCLYPRGKGFGGTTLINGLVYSRGNKLDFDRWESEGNGGWSYKDVLPYFLKSENASFYGGDPGYYSTKGPLHVEQSPYETEYLKAFLQANRELGYSILDYNGRNELGVSKAQFNTLNGRRFTAASAFLSKSIRKRKNLTVSQNSFVTKILINKKTKVAYGVVYMQNGKKKIAIATKEIVLSAGTIASPQILMLSGVGPKQHLQEHNIDVIADLAVGNHLIDHPCYFGLNILTNTSLPINSLRTYLDEYLHGTGIFTLPGNNEGVGFYRVDNSLVGLPDYELMLIPPNRTDSYFQKGFGYSNETYEALYDNITQTSTFSMYLAALHPKSEGTVRLKSSSPFDYPLIDPNMLSDADNWDIDVLYNAIQHIMKLLETDAFKSMDAKIGKVILPGCKDITYSSKEYWFCMLRHLTSNLYHPIGTCKMGNDPSMGAVVDNKLRVYGIKNLRVADGSIFPDALAGHPNAPITMIGEKVSDFIKSV